MLMVYLRKKFIDKMSSSSLSDCTSHSNNIRLVLTNNLTSSPSEIITNNFFRLSKIRMKAINITRATRKRKHREFCRKYSDNRMKGKILVDIETIRRFIVYYADISPDYISKETVQIYPILFMNSPFVKE